MQNNIIVAWYHPRSILDVDKIIILTRKKLVTTESPNKLLLHFDTL